MTQSPSASTRWLILFGMISLGGFLLILSAIARGYPKYSAMIALLPLAVIVGLRIFTHPRASASPLFLTFLGTHTSLSLALISFDTYVLWICLVATPFLLLERKFARLTLPWSFSSGIWLLFLGAILTQIGSLFALRGAGAPLSRGDLLMCQSFSVFVVVLRLLELRWITLRGILYSLLLNGMIFLIYLHALEVIHSGSVAFFSRRFGLYTPWNPNLIAFQYDLLLPLSITAIFMTHSARFRLAFTFLSLCIAFTQLITISRGSLPGIVFCGAYLLWRLRRSKVAMGGAIAFSLVAIAVFIPPFLSRILTPSTADTGSNLGRIFLLRSAWRMLEANHYIFGVGIDNFKILKEKYGFPLWFNPDRTMSSHNTFMELWVGWGLTALVGWFILLYGTVISLLQSSRTNSQEHPFLAQAFALSILGYSFHGFVDSSLALESLTLQFSTILACSAFLLLQRKTLQLG